MNAVYDTNALSGWADDFPEVVTIAKKQDRIVIPTIVLGEYKFGLKGSRLRYERELWLQKSLPRCEVHPITQTTADIYAEVCHGLKSLGRIIQHNDMWIAACALELDLPVLSNDLGFDRIRGIVRIPFADPRLLSQG